MGSLGDTVVVLPVFHMLAEKYANAKRRALTNKPVNSNAAAIQAILGDGGFVDGYFAYPHCTRDFGDLNQLRHQIRDWGPDLVIYLNEPRGNLVQFRDIKFSKMFGARQILGVPATADLSTHRQNSELGLWEPETSWLARCVADIGDVDLDVAKSWSLIFTTAEEESARKRCRSGAAKIISSRLVSAQKSILRAGEIIAGLICEATFPATTPNLDWRFSVALMTVNDQTKLQRGGPDQLLISVAS